ncbi:hypothetical protein jhhlp_007959 [Lomentospora prolificans]|uniref:Uncharacterized protein n=1 Tax=Lomentospora prolificans TaxID=41688 RepID=A0A2N3MZV2_9PEZI|nr:hypothetical protein jhhlp_007959 [Lomentospora prolificans]
MPLAAFRRSSQQDDLTELAKSHLKNDLTEGDRKILKKSATRVATPTSFGSLLGLGLGVYFAYKLRRGRVDMFNAFKAAQKPTQVVFADGRTEAIPDITGLLRPTALGDAFTYFFCGLGGLFLGGETGFLAGTWSATRAIRKNPESEKRIEVAYRKFKADCLRREAQRLESGSPVTYY